MKLENVQDIYPLTPMQEGMLFHCISEPESGAYVDQIIVSLEGELNTERFFDAFRRVAARFDVLRTAFVWDGVDKPLQIVREQVAYDLAVMDGIQGGGESARHQLEDLVAANRAQGFVLEEAPLIRLTLVRQGPKQTELLLCFHHLILDGWSARTLLHRVLREYDDIPSHQPEYRFRDYVEWIGTQDHAAARLFWREQLKGFGERNRLGSQEHALSGAVPHQQRSIRLSSSSKLREMARRHSLTLNTTLLAAWSLVVSRYSGGDRDVVFGTTVAGRDPRLPGIQQAVGSFINTLPFRAQIDAEAPLGECAASFSPRRARSVIGSLRRWPRLKNARMFLPGRLCLRACWCLRTTPRPLSRWGRSRRPVSSTSSIATIHWH